jgi:hypothetical protein
MTAWDDFRSTIPARLLLPINNYSFTLEWVQFDFNAQQQAAFSQQLTRGVIEALRVRGEAQLSSLSFDDPRANSSRFFYMNYGSPIYSFAIGMTHSSVWMARSGATVEDYFYLAGLLDEVARQIFGANSKFSLAQYDFFSTAYRATHSFRQEFVVGSHVTDESKSRVNLELASEFVRFEEGSLLNKLNPESIGRADATVALTKTISGRPASIWIEMNAPYSPTRRDLSFDLQLRRGETSSAGALEVADLFEFSTVAREFYRDTVLDRLYRPLFADTTVTPAV